MFESLNLDTGKSTTKEQHINNIILFLFPTGGGGKKDTRKKSSRKNIKKRKHDTIRLNGGGNGKNRQKTIKHYRRKYNTIKK